MSMKMKKVLIFSIIAFVLLLLVFFTIRIIRTIGELLGENPGMLTDEIENDYDLNVDIFHEIINTYHDIDSVLIKKDDYDSGDDTLNRIFNDMQYEFILKYPGGDYFFCKGYVGMEQYGLLYHKKQLFSKDIPPKEKLIRRLKSDDMMQGWWYVYSYNIL